MTCMDSSLKFEFTLDKKKMILGSFDACDIKIEHEHISYYHAIILLDDGEGGTLIDLDSKNGTYINGERVKKANFLPGDIIRLGTIDFRLEEIIKEVDKKSDPILDQDKGHTSQIISRDIIPPMPPIDHPPKSGLMLIDDEYCDIVFDESKFVSQSDLPTIGKVIDINNYVDFWGDTKAEPIYRRKPKVISKVFEVTVLSMGNIISIDYLTIKNRTFYISADQRSGHTVQVPLFDSKDARPFIKVKKGNINFMCPKDFTAINLNNTKYPMFNGTDVEQFEEGDLFSFINQTVQIIVKVVDQPPQTLTPPFLGRDRELQIRISKVMGSIIGLMLLLLLVDINVPEPEKKKIAIIFKRKAVTDKDKSVKKASDNAAKKEKDTGIKKKEQDKKKVKMAKAEQKKMDKPLKKPTPPLKTVSKKTKKPTPPKKTVTKKTVKTNKPLPKKAPTKSVTAPKPVKVAKMKAYKFKMKKSMSSLFGSTSSNVKMNKNGSAASVSSNTFSASTNTKGLSQRGSDNVKGFGKDLKGRYSTSSGTKGLASKRGINTTYVDPKTVILGSMDPGLLRKILREYLPQFRHCYQKELEINESIKGTISLGFRINRNGNVSKIRIRGKRAKFTRRGRKCMSNVLRIIPFPKPKGGGVVDVKQPLSFVSEKENI